MSPSEDHVAIGSLAFDGDLPRTCHLIEVRVSEIRELFNAMDPGSLGGRALDPAAADFIEERATEVPASTPLGLMVHLDQSTGAPYDPGALQLAIRQFFGHKEQVTRRRLSALFRRGRISLAIGLAFLAGSSGLATALAGATNGLGAIVLEGLIIGGWVAMWRPLEVFLYDWWPILSEARRYEQLAAMRVRIR